MEIAIFQQFPFSLAMVRPKLLDKAKKKELLRTSSTYAIVISSERVGKAKYKRRNANNNKRGYKVQNAKYKMQDVKYKIPSSK